MLHLLSFRLRREAEVLRRWEGSKPPKMLEEEEEDPLIQEEDMMIPTRRNAGFTHWELAIIKPHSSK